MPVINGEYICKLCGFNAGKSPFALMEHAQKIHPKRLTRSLQ